MAETSLSDDVEALQNEVEDLRAEINQLKFHQDDGVSIVQVDGDDYPVPLDAGDVINSRRTSVEDFIRVVVNNPTWAEAGHAILPGEMYIAGGDMKGMARELNLPIDASDNTPDKADMTL